jgi:hypothetical protein
LVSDVGQHRLEGFDVAVDIANEGYFHARNFPRSRGLYKGGRYEAKHSVL